MIRADAHLRSVDAVFRPLTTAQLTADIVFGVLWALIGLLVVHSLGIGAVGVLVVTLLAAAFTIRRLSPGLALAVAWAGSLIQVAAGVGPAFFDLPIFSVVYATAAYGGRVVRLLGLVSAPVGAAVIALGQLLIEPSRLGESVAFGPLVLPAAVWGAMTTFVGFLIAFLLAWTFGSLVRSWRTSREARRAEAEAQREVVIQQERNRIARELHDVVAHSLAVMVAQADGARYASGAAAKDSALATIASTGREALGDVRLLLARLRHEEGAEPQPSLADLDGLVEQVRASGLDVRFERSGTPAALPPGQQLAVYRIVQEALTNALRHGDAGEPVTVGLRWSATGLDVDVRNVAAGAPQPAGHGLPGMRERASLAGGELTAGQDGREWRITATIPVGGGA